MDISFTDLSVTVRSTGKLACDRITAKARRGRLLAVMGPTGSGKTTCLNAVAHRFDPALAYRGTVTYGRCGGWTKNLKRRIGFVEQDDLVEAELTVRQTLDFEARLRLPRSLTSAERAARVSRVVADLHLGECAKTRVGDAAARGISGGERKRLCIARELLTDPLAILFDEPTSGLDSSTAMVVIECMRELATSSGLTVLTTIHQPSSQMFARFDDLLLLGAGRVYFRGPAGTLVDALAAVGDACPPLHNPADWVMDLIVRARRHEDAGACKALAKHFDGGGGGGDGERKEEKSAQQNGDHEGADATDAIHDQRRYTATFATQVEVLVRRTWCVVRPTIVTSNTVILNLGLAGLTAMLWFGLGKSERDVYLRMSLVFWLTGTFMFLPLFGSIYVFATDEVSVKKDLANGAYKLSAYYVARSLVLAAQEALWPCVYMIIVYGLSGLNTALIFFRVMAAIFMWVLVTQSIALALGASIKSAVNLLTTSILMMTYLFGYGGLFVPIDRIPSWLRWTVGLNSFTYFYHLLFHLVLTDDVTFTCASPPSDSEFAVCRGEGRDALSIPNATTSRPLPEVITRADVLAHFKVTTTPATSLAFLLSVLVFCRVFAYAALRWRLVLRQAQLGAEMQRPLPQGVEKEQQQQQQQQKQQHGGGVAAIQVVPEVKK